MFYRQYWINYKFIRKKYSKFIVTSKEVMKLTKLNEIKSYPIRDNNEILSILLKDRTSRKNIIWATDSYGYMGEGFSFNDNIKLNLLDKSAGQIIKPRAEKDDDEQIIRTRSKGEVFTPTWIINKKIDYIESEIEDLNFENYIDYKWLEITCGEGPYITSRYDTVTGQYLDIEDRVGFLDRKIKKISEKTDDEVLWFSLVQRAYKSSYGYEYQGDSLLVARENLLNSFIDYYKYKFGYVPDIEKIKIIAKIISYNVFQMDGLKYTIPTTDIISTQGREIQLSFLEEEGIAHQLEVVTEEDQDSKIKNWLNNKMINFQNLVNDERRAQSMKFDVVIGNPPYQENNKNRNRDDAIYHYFIDSSYKIGNKVILISPGRFLFNVGSTPKTWNIKMLSDKHVKVIFYESDSSKIFSNTDIKGGIAITYRDNSRNFGSIDVFLPNKNIASIVKKVSLVEKSKYGSFGEIMYVQNKFNLDNLYSDYPEFKNRLSSKGKERRLTSSIFNLISEIFEDERSEKNNIGIYGRENNERVYKYINSKYLEKNLNLNKWKVFVPAANGSGEFGEILNSPVVGSPGTGHTQTFISIGAFDNEFEGYACLKYLKTKFARAMLGALKVTQNNKIKETWSKVPIQDFTTSSDIDWSKSICEIDQQLYKKYGLNEDEINFIESKVKEMD